MRTYLEAKAMAKSLRAALSARNITLSHGECLEIVAKQFGFNEWNMLSAKIDLETGVRPPPPESPGIALQPPIPVVRISSVKKAKEFYIDFLGFVADWGWPEDDDDRPLYAQISRSGVTLHLSEHRGEGAPRRAELFIRMTGLALLREELMNNNEAGPQDDTSTLPKGSKVLFRHTPDDRWELQVSDPFGNWLRFSENKPRV
jgi:catechol 2,3-dioxygenase-like lactoylglutathione lyase family enzyme